MAIIYSFSTPVILAWASIGNDTFQMAELKPCTSDYYSNAPNASQYGG